jgi:ribonuclease HI
MVYDKALNIHADGSPYSHPRRAGMGIRYVTINSDGDEVVQSEEIPGHEGATNNEMELLACIKGLKDSKVLLTTLASLKWNACMYSAIRCMSLAT